jgi:pimeloyl-ACP methyl ester carboxylesterase
MNWLARIVAVLAAFISVMPAEAASGLGIDQPKRSVSRAAVDEEMYVRIGGIEQWVTINGQNRANPVVLILHGGPGAAFSPFDDSAFGAWRQKFTVVQWDQRGAGRTYSSGPSIESTMTIDRMVKDGVELSEFLTTHLHKDKIVIFGGSWGSILGVYMAKARTDLFCAYVGTAQIVNSEQGMEASYKRFMAMARRANDKKAISAVEGLGPLPWHSFKTLLAYYQWTNVYEA